MFQFNGSIAIQLGPDTWPNAPQFRLQAMAYEINEALASVMESAVQSSEAVQRILRQCHRLIGSVKVRSLKYDMGDTSSTVMGARTTSFKKYLEHRNACVGLVGKNLEPHKQWEARTAGNSNTL